MLRNIAILIVLSCTSCQPTFGPRRVLVNGVCRTSVAELISVPEIYEDTWVQFLGWAQEDLGLPKIYLSPEHAKYFDDAASVLVAPQALPDPMPCAGHLVYIEGTFGVIEDLGAYGLTSVRRLWTPEGPTIETEPRHFQQQPVCSWSESEKPAV